MEILVLFILIWLISPLILGVVCICQASELKRLRKQLSDKQEGIHSDVSHKQDIHGPEKSAVPQGEKSSLNTSNHSKSENENKSENTYANMYAVPQAPVHEEMAQPYIPHESHAETPKNGTNASVVIMVLGAMFITLAGFVFAAAAWGNLNNFFKSAVLISFSAVFFAMHLIAARKLKLEAAGKVFFVLGSVLLPAAAAAGGMLGVFGRWFSFFGGGCALVFMTMFLLLSGCFFVGTHIYKSTSFSRIAYASLSAAFVSLMIQFREYADFAAVLAGIVLLAMTLFEPQIKCSMGAVGEEFHFFTTVCTWSLAAVSLIISDGSLWFLLPAVLISASFMAGAARSRQPSAGVVAFGVYLLAGVIRGISPSSADGWIICASAVIAAITVLCMMNFFSEDVRTVLSGFSRVISTIIIIGAVLCEIIGGGFNGFELTMLISAAVMFAQSAFVNVRNGGYAKVQSAVTFGWLAYETASFVHTLTPYGAAFCVLGALMLAYYAISELSPLKKYFYVNNLGIAVFAAELICMFAVNISIYSAAVIFVMWLMTAAAAVIGGRNGGKASVMLPIAFLALAYPIYAYDPFKVLGEFRYYDAYAITAVIYCIAACAAVLIKPLRRFSKAFSPGIPVICLLYPFAAHKPIIAAAAAVTVYAVIGWAYDVKRKYSGAYGFFALFMICALGYELGRTNGGTAAYIAAAVLMILMFGVYIFPKNGESAFGESTFLSAADSCGGSFLAAAMPLYSVLLMYEGCEGDRLLYPCGVLLMLFGCGAAVMRKNSAFAAIDMLAWYFLTYSYFNDMNTSYSEMPWIYVLIGAVIASVIGRIVFRKKLWNGKSFDFFSMTAAVELIVLLSDGGQYAVWLGIGMVGLILLNLVRKENSASVNKLFLTLAALVIMPFWWTQPVLTLPEIIVTEWNIIPAAAFAVLIRLIYKGSDVADLVSFADAAICVIVLFVAAMKSGYAADAVILGAAIVLILFISFALRQKRWFALAAVSAVVEALFLTARLWNSRTWWIYLLAAGVILTAAGVSGEALKRKSGGEKSKLAKMMSEWRW